MRFIFKGKNASCFTINSISENTSSSAFEPEIRAEAGFSLIEVSIAMLIILIALLGVFVTFTYAINYNAGNNSRAQALAVLQREVELMRSAKFTPNVTDHDAPSIPDDGKRDLYGGIKTTRTTTSADGNRFIVDVSVDNDPLTDGIQTTNESTSTIKEISVTVKLANPTPGWQTFVPATVVLRRVRSN